MSPDPAPEDVAGLDEHDVLVASCAGWWVCDSDPAHDVAEVGALARRDAGLSRIE